MNRTLTRKKAAIDIYDLFVGVDIGKWQNQAMLLDRQWRVLARLTFSQNREGYQRFKDWLARQQRRLGGAQVVVGMEPTNDYWSWLAHYLEGEAVAYRLVNPYTVKKNREGAQLDRAKDDPRDGWTIGRLLGEGQYTETQLSAEIYREMRYYEQAHWRLSGQIRQQKTVLRQTVERLFPELRTVFKKYTGLTCRAVLARHADPRQVRALSFEAFERGVRQDFSGQRLCLRQVRQVYELAATTIGLPSDGALPLLVGQQLALLELLLEQRDVVAQQLVACLQQLPAVVSFGSLGLGAVQTALIVAELGDLDRFSHAKQLVKLAGTQPTPNSSGTMVQKMTPMSRKGRGRLRTYLFRATVRLLRTDPAFRARHQQLITRQVNPLPKLAAVGVLMNKLLHLLWMLHSQRCCYSADRFLPSA